MAADLGELIRQDYESNTWLIQRTLEGVTHIESLLQPPFKANCVNWVLGHILAGRHIALQVLGRPAFWDETALARYRGGSAPVTGEAPGVRPLEGMLADVTRSQALLDERLGACTEAELERTVDVGRGERPAWQELAGRRWHETYHVGQLGTLRQFVNARRARGEPKPQFIYAFEPVRPEMVTDAYAWTERETEIAAEHFAYLQRATQAGTVLLAGRSLDGIGPAIVILEAGSEAEARGFMESDPFVANGLMRARLHPYRAALLRSV